MKKLLFIILVSTYLLSGQELKDSFSWVDVPAGTFTYKEYNYAKNIEYNYKIMKYEVTNSEYIKYLNEAIAKGNVTVNDTAVIGYYDGDSKLQAGNYAFYHLNDYAFQYKVKFIIWQDSTFTIEEGYENHPVVAVSWYGANAFAKHYGYDLPTEEEWEKAARGNTGYNYPFGNNLDSPFANYMDSGDSFDNGTTPVGFFNGENGTGNNMSPYGAYDMTGNVWEWTKSFHGGQYPKQYTVRGGAWSSFSDKIECWRRGFRFTNNDGSFALGFRCVKRETATSIDENNTELPTDFSLLQNYPNPFNPSTNIIFNIFSANHVQLKVYNALGNEVTVLVDEYKNAGSYKVKFNGKNFASGIYFYTLIVDGKRITKKALLIK